MKTGAIILTKPVSLRFSKLVICRTGIWENIFCALQFSSAASAAYLTGCAARTIVPLRGHHAAVCWNIATGSDGRVRLLLIDDEPLLQKSSIPMRFAAEVLRAVSNKVPAVTMHFWKTSAAKAVR
jgi:hypothetical protein